MTAPSLDERQRSSAPLTLAQERLWLIHVSDSRADRSYHVPVRLDLSAEPDRRALRQAVADLVERHAALRTVIDAEDGLPRQRTMATEHAMVRVWREADAADLTEALAAFSSEPFELSVAPAIRVCLFETADGRYALAMVLHHIACDAYSVELLVDELELLYAQRTGCGSADLQPVQCTMAEHAEEQRRWLESGAAAQAEEHWRRLLQDPPAAPDLPAPRRPLPSANVIHSVTLGPAAARRLLGVARELHCTPAALTYAVFGVLLGLYTQQDEQLVGTALSARDDPRLDCTVGFLTSMVPLRLAAQDRTFEALAEEVQEQLFDALDHRDVAIEPLVRLARRAVGATSGTSFEITVGFGQLAPAGAGRSGAVMRRVPVADSHPKFALNLDAWLCGDSLVAQIECDRAALDERLPPRMLDTLAHLLQLLPGKAGEVMADLDLLPEAERQRALGWNPVPVTLREPLTIHGRFARCVSHTPGAVATRDPSGRLTYLELDQRAESIRRALAPHIAGRGTRVGVLARPDRYLPAALVAILRAGGAYVPLDPRTPSPRIRWMLEQAGAEAVVGDPDLAASHGLALPVIPAAASEPVPQHGGAPSGHAQGGDDLAYVMFTSGSTGRPKGVLVPHAALLRLVDGGHYPGLGPGCVMAQLASLNFDVSGLELWGPLLTGGCVAFPPSSEEFLQRPGDVIGQLGVTALNVAPSQLNLLVDEHLAELSDLEMVVFGGEVASVPHVRKAVRAWPATALVHAYGPTECTIDATVSRVGPDTIPEGWPTVPLGDPVTNTEVFLLDERLRPVPVGARGEICLGGGGLAQGYIDPAETERAFVHHPLASGGRIYRTGDYARRHPDGLLEFLGRRDDQHQIRGQRVELAEVEACLREHPAIRQVAVAAQAAEGGVQLEAHVVLRSVAHAPEHADLSDFAASRLPRFMVPSRFRFTPALPLSRSGKLDRSQLPAVRSQTPAPDPPRPVDLFERAVREVVAELVDVAGVSSGDRLLDLGVDSIAALRVAARLERRVGRACPLHVLLADPTIGDIADMLRSPGSRPDVTRLNHAQGRPAVLLLSALGGSLQRYKPLARRLPYETSGVVTPARATTLTAAAAMVADLVLARSRALDLVLAGWSLDGLLALEVAARLAERGSPAALTLLLDSYPPSPERASSRRTEMLRDLRHEAARLLGRPPPFDVDDVAALPVDAQREAALRGITDPEERASVALLHDTLDAQLRAFERHVPTMPPGRVVVLRPRQYQPDPWDVYSAVAVEVLPTPGGHHSMLSEPAVVAVAETFRDAVDAHAMS